MRWSVVVIPMVLLLPAMASAQEEMRGSTQPAQARINMSNGYYAGREGMSAAVRRVERATGGQVLNVESLRFEGREIHRVKVLTPDGRVMVVIDDPARHRLPLQLQELRPTRNDDT